MTAFAAPTGLLVMLRLLVYLGAVVLVGGAISYPVWLALQDVLGPVEFHRVVFRCLKATAVAGVVVWLRCAGALSWAAWGVSGGWARFARRALAGFGLGICMMAALVGMLVVLEARILRDGAALAQLPGLLWRGAVIGVVVAVVEELWFRGGLYSALEQPPRGRAERAAAAGGWRALALTSGLYAAVHFVWPDGAVTEDIGWWSGWLVITQSFYRFTSAAIIDSFVALAAAGLVLGMVRRRSGDVAACIGMHAGWIGVIYPARKLTVIAPAPGSLVGTYDGIVGWLAAVMFLACACALAARARAVGRGG